MNEIQITTETVKKGIVAMSIKGTIDSQHAVDKLTDIFTDFLAQDIYKFIVDLSQLDYIGSVGTNVFIDFSNILRQNRGAIVFIYPQVKKGVNIFELLKCYSIAPDRASALKKLRRLSSTIPPLRSNPAGRDASSEYHA